MIVLVLGFTDDPRRSAARPAHRARLRRMHAAGQLVMAGPWADGSGALLVLDVRDDEADDILSADPYYTTPGVTLVERRSWNPLPFG